MKENEIAIKPEIIEWAISRSRKSIDEYFKNFPNINNWGKDKFPTIRQLEAFARKAAIPFGYLFLNEPLIEKLPIPDFRTFSDKPVKAPSPELIETIQIMQRRQSWAREYFIEKKEPPKKYIKSFSIKDGVIKIAEVMKAQLELPDNWAKDCRNWEDALKAICYKAEKIGILVVSNGVVGNNTHRNLELEEFRGFVLVDEFAPLIFLNNKDAKAAQMFTIVHELVHLWLGLTGVVNFEKLLPASNDIEIYCNSVAAEILVPYKIFSEEWIRLKNSQDIYNSLARTFKVSQLVCARRALDLKYIKLADFYKFYNEYLEILKNIKKSKGDGGDFIYSQNGRVGKLFAEIVNTAAIEGKLLYREAYQLTGLRGKNYDDYINYVQGQ